MESEIGNDRDDRGADVGQLPDLRDKGGGAGGEFGAAALAWVGVLRFDQAVTMVISAVAAKKAIQATRVFLSKKG